KRTCPLTGLLQLGNEMFTPELSPALELVSSGLPRTTLAPDGGVYDRSHPVGLVTSIRNSAPVIPFSVAPSVLAMTYSVVAVYGATVVQGSVPVESRYTPTKPSPVWAKALPVRVASNRAQFIKKRVGPGMAHFFQPRMMVAAAALTRKPRGGCCR